MLPTANVVLGFLKIICDLRVEGTRDKDTPSPKYRRGKTDAPFSLFLTQVASHPSANMG